MNKEQAYKEAYMSVAERFSKMSHAIRLQVGTVVVKEDRIISIGWNGMPTGWDNNCEDIDWDMGAGGWLDPEEFDKKYPYETWNDDVGMLVRYGLKTKPEVLHSEANAIVKLACSTESSVGADIYITHSPCVECAKLILQSKVARVFYKNDYRDSNGVNFLIKSGIEVEKLNTIPDEGIDAPKI